jgi:hypothetical protein
LGLSAQIQNAAFGQTARIAKGPPRGLDHGSSAAERKNGKITRKHVVERGSFNLAPGRLSKIPKDVADRILAGSSQRESIQVDGLTAASSGEQLSYCRLPAAAKPDKDDAGQPGHVQKLTGSVNYRLPSGTSRRPKRRFRLMIRRPRVVRMRARNPNLRIRFLLLTRRG